MTLAAVAFAVCLLAGAVLFVGTRPLERLRPGALAAFAGVTAAAYAALLVVRPANVLLADLAVLASALVLGSALGSMLRGSVGLGSFCITAAIVDVVSSHSGAPALPFIAATTLAGLWLAARLSKLAPDAREPRGRGLRR